jgi:hypothetical protein
MRRCSVSQEDFVILFEEASGWLFELAALGTELRYMRCRRLGSAGCQSSNAQIYVQMKEPTFNS